MGMVKILNILLICQTRTIVTLRNMDNPKDPRYDTIRGLLAAGALTRFTDIFAWIPPTVVAKDLHTNGTRMKRMIKNPEEFQMKDINTIAHLIGCDPKKLGLMAVIEAKEKLEQREGKG